MPTSAVMPRAEIRNPRSTANWLIMFQDERSKIHTAPNVMPTLSFPKVNLETKPSVYKKKKKNGTVCLSVQFQTGTTFNDDVVL